MFKDWSWKQLILPTLLVVAVLINKAMIQPPAAKDVHAPPAEFSAERAMEHVRAIATAPHPVGTSENARVRAYVLSELEEAGLETEVQSTQILNQYLNRGSRRTAAFVHNVIARMRGSDPDGQSLLLMSHYDSVYYGPGAGDDAAGTATILEVIRALKAGVQPRNDIIFLITDAEEVGLFGAQAFFDKHPLAADVGLVLNFEARGSKGPVSMFQTSAMNDRLVKTFAETVKRPNANSLTVTIYENMPNDTDMSISLRDGIPGMNFAFIEGFYDYHTKGDNPENLSTATLQHMGDQALAMTQAMANQTLPMPDARPSVFFDVLTLFLISYPVWLSWVVLVAAAGLLSIYIRLQISSGALKTIGIMKGAVGALLFIVLFALTVDLLFLMIGGRSGDFVESRRLFALAGEQVLAYTLLGFGGFLAYARGMTHGFGKVWLAGGALLSILLWVFEPSFVPGIIMLVGTATSWALFKTTITPDERESASLLIVLLVGALVQILAPAGSHLFLWPLIFMVIGLLLYLRDHINEITLAGFGLLGALWLMYFTEMGYSALGISFPGIVAVPFGILMLLIAPALLSATQNSHRSIAGISIVLGFAGILYAGVATGFNDRLNKPTEAFYVVNTNSDGINHFGTSMPALDRWASQILTGELETIPYSAIIPSREGTLTLAAAPAADVTPPSVSNITRHVNQTNFRVTPGFEGHIIALFLKSTAPITEVTIDGEPFAATNSNDFTLYYFAVPKTGLDFGVQSEGDISLHAAEITAKWPDQIAGQIPEKPSDIMMAPYRFSDSTIAFTKLDLIPNE